MIVIRYFYCKYSWKKSLRKLLEASKAVIPCYKDNEMSLKIIKNKLNGYNGLSTQIINLMTAVIDN